MRVKATLLRVSEAKKRGGALIRGRGLNQKNTVFLYK